MKRHNPSDFDGFEKKPEEEWTERDRVLLDHYGVVPLTEAGEKAYLEKMRQSPQYLESIRFLDKLLEGVKAREAAEGRTGTPRQDSDGGEA